MCAFRALSQTFAMTQGESITTGVAWIAQDGHAHPIQLDVHANVPSASQARFIDAALAAKTNCPIASLLKASISMTATLDR
jgi:organic hydroperoxide reductase OsmC/OhrA